MITLYGCVLCLPLNEGSGVTAFDVSGAGNNANISGATYIGGVCGTGLQFDGIDDFATTTNPVLVPNGFTVLCWWKRNGASGGATASTYHTIITYLNGGTTSNQLLVNAVGTTVTGQVNIGTAPTASKTISPTAWNHIGSMWDGSNLYAIVNGVLSSPTAASGTLNSGTVILSIGRRNATSLLANGIIDDLRVYSYPLSPPEIYAVYKEGIYCPIDNKDVLTVKLLNNQSTVNLLNKESTVKLFSNESTVNLYKDESTVKMFSKESEVKLR